MGLVSLLLSFQGRINRGQYWLGSSIIFIVGIVALIALFAMAGPVFRDWVGTDKYGESMNRFVIVVGVILTPVGLIMNWSGFALQVKRFHDRGRSGYLAALPAVLSTIIAVTALSDFLAGVPLVEVGASLGPLPLILWLMHLAILIDLGMLPSVGPNKHGDPPGSAAPSAITPTRADPSAASLSPLFGGAEQAIDRAAAQHQRMAAQVRPQTGLAPRPAGGGFGRRASPG